MKLDLASGPNPQEGHYGVDLVPYNLQVVQLDLINQPWGWQTNSIEHVYCSHFVEHVPNLVRFMNEVGRILAPGGEARIIHPYQHSNRAWQDPTHVRALNEESWSYYSAKWREANNLGDYLGIQCDLQVVSVTYVLAPQFLDMPASKQDELRQMARHNVNIVDDLDVVLRKVDAE